MTNFDVVFDKQKVIVMTNGESAKKSRETVSILEKYANEFYHHSLVVKYLLKDLTVI